MIINVDGMEWFRRKWNKMAKSYLKFGGFYVTKFFDKVITEAKGMLHLYYKEFNCKSRDIAYATDIQYPVNPELINKFKLKQLDYYLIASRLVPDYNTELIIRAFIKSKTIKKLVIVGGTPYENPCGEKIKYIQDDRIIFLGHIDDQNMVKELYCSAYAYIHGREYGGTNPSLLKALAYGNCVLAINTVFNRAVLKDGEYGILFEKSIDDLASQINQIDEHEEINLKLRLLARIRIRERYTLKKITEHNVSLFDNMLKK